MITVDELLDIFVNDKGQTEGGYLHIVLSDENLEDRMVAYCYRQALINNDIITCKLCEILIPMDYEGRLNIVDKFQNIAGYPNARKLK